MHNSRESPGSRSTVEISATSSDSPAPIALRSCAYLHNYVPHDGDTLFSSKFASLLARYPTFTADDVDPLSPDYPRETRE